VPFVFGHFEMGPLNVVFTKENAAGREAVSAAMRQYWAQFARTGNPAKGTSGTLPAWQPVGTERALLFDLEKNGGVRMASAGEHQQTILDDLLADPRLDAKERCRVVHELTTWGRSLTRAEYDAQPRCHDFAFETYPWK
jgi:para-nitrobenzyl esterase